MDSMRLFTSEDAASMRRRSSILMGAGGGGTVMARRARRAGSPGRSPGRILLTPQVSEPSTPSAGASQGADPDPAVQGQQSPVSGAVKFAQMPDLVSVYETVGGKQLIAQAVQRTSTLLPSDDDGWNKTWTSGVTDAFRETLLKYAPMIVHAQEEAELARDTEQDDETQRATEHALIEQAIAEIEERSQDAKITAVNHAVDSVTSGTVLPAMQGSLSALAVNVEDDESDDEDNAQLSAALAESHAEELERQFERSMSEIAGEAEQLGSALKQGAEEAERHADCNRQYVALATDQSEDGLRKASDMQKQIEERETRMKTLEGVKNYHLKEIRKKLAAEYPIAARVQNERRLQDAKLDFSLCNDLTVDPHPAKARRMLTAVWKLVSDHVEQMWALVPMVFMMKEEQDIICPPEPYDKEKCHEFLPEQLATYYANHSELLFRKLQDHGDALISQAVMRRKTGEEGFDARESKGVRGCGISCISALRHKHEKEGPRIIRNYQALLHNQWHLFIETTNISQVCADVRKLTMEARELRIEINYYQTVYQMAAALRPRNPVFFNGLEKWLHFDIEDKHDAIEKLDEFLTEVEHFCTQMDGGLVDGVQSTESRAAATARAVWSEAVKGGGTPSGQSKQPRDTSLSDWVCCASGCTNMVPNFAKKLFCDNQKESEKALPTPENSRLLCNEHYREMVDSGKSIALKDGTHKTFQKASSGESKGGKPGKGGKGGRGGRRQGRAARAEAKKKKKEAESQPEPEPEPEPSMSDDLAQTVATAAAAAATAASEAAIARVLREHQIGTTDGANASAATAAPSPAPSAPAEGTPPSSVDIVAAVRDAMTR